MKHVDPKSLNGKPRLSLDEQMKLEEEETKRNRKIRNILRLSEVRKVIVDRYGHAGECPNVVEAHGLLFALMDATIGLHGEAKAVPSVLKWCKKFAPWAREMLIEEVFEDRYASFRLPALECGWLLRLSHADRTRLDIRTIQSFNLTPKQAEDLAKDRRRGKGKSYSASYRRKAGSKPRAMSMTQLEPWIDLGFSESKFRKLPYTEQERLAAIVVAERATRGECKNSSAHTPYSPSLNADEFCHPRSHEDTNPASKAKPKNQKERDGQGSAPRSEAFEAFCAALAAFRLRLQAKGEAAAAEELQRRNAKVLAWLKQSQTRMEEAKRRPASSA